MLIINKDTCIPKHEPEIGGFVSSNIFACTKDGEEIVLTRDQIHSMSVQMNSDYPWNTQSSFTVTFNAQIDAEQLENLKKLF